MRRSDIGGMVALVWLMSAVGVTILLGPQLGIRGWAWLGAHHVLCLVGCTHELWRYRKRERLRAAQRLNPSTPGD